MTVAGSEAIAKIPTVQEEMDKFKGFSVKDGEVFDGKEGSQADARAAAEAAEQHAANINKRSHEENKVAGTTTTERGKAAEGAAPAKVELSAEEEETAIQDATDKAGRQLTDEEADEVVGKALQAKERTAAKEGRKKDVQARMGELTRLRRTAERETESLRRDNEDLRRRLDALERGERPLTNGTQGDKKVSQSGKPDPADTAKYQYGELDAKYIADLARYETLQAIAEREEGKTKEQNTKAEAEAIAAFEESKTAFEEAGLEQFDDFEDVVIATYSLDPKDPGFWPLSQTMAELIFESDHGPAVAYHLASNPKEARRIAALSPARQATWFGVKEAELSAGSAASSKTTTDDGVTKPQAEAGTKRTLPQPRNGQARESKAPLPLTKLNGAGGNRMPSSATTDFAQFEALAKGGKK